MQKLSQHTNCVMWFNYLPALDICLCQPGMIYWPQIADVRPYSCNGLNYTPLFNVHVCYQGDVDSFRFLDLWSKHVWWQLHPSCQTVTFEFNEVFNQIMGNMSFHFLFHCITTDICKLIPGHIKFVRAQYFCNPGNAYIYIYIYIYIWTKSPMVQVMEYRKSI